MGSGFAAINIGDEIIEINNQLVVGDQFDASSSHLASLCRFRSVGIQHISMNSFVHRPHPTKSVYW
jgi:hypothetical protein